MELDLTTNPLHSVVENHYGIHRLSFFRSRKPSYTRWGMTFTRNGLYNSEGAYTDIPNTTTQPSDVGMDVYQFPNKEFFGTMYVKPTSLFAPRTLTYTAEYSEWMIKTFQESQVITWEEIMRKLLDSILVSIS